MTQADQMRPERAVGLKRSATGVNQKGILKRGAWIFEKGVRDYIIFPSRP